MGFSLRNAWEGADFWDKEENRQQKAAATVRATQSKPAPAQTKSQTRIPYRDGLRTSNNGPTLQQQQNANNYQDFKTKKIDRAKYEENLRNILGIKQEKLGNVDQFVKNQADFVSRNPVLRPTLTGLASWSPTNLGGNVVGYAGRAGEALGIDGSQNLTQIGDRVANLHRADQQGEFRNRGLSDSLISGGIELAGDLAAFGAGGLAKGGVMGLSKAGKAGTVLAKGARLAPTTRFFTQSANSLAGEMTDAGYSPTTSLLAGSALGGVSAGLERVGLGGITNKVAGAGARAVTTRLVSSALTEGLTEGSQELAENVARKYTVNPNQNVFENVAESALVGGLLGGGANVGVQVGGRYSGEQGKQNFQQDTKAVADKYKQSTALPNKVKLTDNELYTMSDYADVLLGTNKVSAIDRNNITKLARQTADKAGVDVVSGSPVEINNRIGKFIEDYKLGENAKGQVGAIGKDVRPDSGKAMSVDPKAPESRYTPAQKAKDTKAYNKSLNEFAEEVKAYEKTKSQAPVESKASKPQTLSAANDIQKYSTFDAFYKDYNNFFDDSGFSKNDANVIYDAAQNQSLVPAGGRNTRVSSSAQTQFEQAYNNNQFDKAREAAQAIEDPVARNVAIQSINARTGGAETSIDTSGVTNPTVLKMMEAAKKRKAETAAKPTLQDALEGKSTKVRATKLQVQPKKSQQTKADLKVDTSPSQDLQSPRTTERINRPLQDISKDSPVNVDKFISEQVKLQDKKVKKTGKLADAKRKWVDSLAPAEDNFRQAVADGKISQETLDDIIVKNGQSLRAGTVANLNLQESGLVELLHGMEKSDYDNFGQVITAIHSNDLRANKIETGRDSKVDNEIINKYGKQFESEIKQFRESADYVLNKAVEHQLISKDTAKLLKKKYPNYVPMNRVIAEIENSGSFNSSQIASIGSQTVVRKIKGSKRAVQNPVESMIAKVQDMSRQGMRNEASLAWVDALKETGGAKRIDGTVKPGESTISVIRNGNKEIYSVDPEIEGAAKGLTKEQMNVAVETMRKISRVFKTGTTGLNLPFTVTNLVRDQQTAFLNMQKGEVDAFKAMPKALMETLGHGKVYQEALRNGAISTSFDLTKPTHKLTAKDIRKRGSKLGALSKIEDVVGRSEEYTRLQQYMGTKDYWLNKGLSESEAQTKATIAAQQNSADFARAGDFGRVLNAVLPYTNASVQGTRAYLRSAKANPKRYALKATATLAVPMAMVAAWNYSDDDREEVINDISEFDKQANFIIVTPWAKKNDEGKWEGIVKVPKPPGIAALTYPIEQTIAWSRGNDPVAFDDISKALLGFASPLGDNTKSAVSTITPQALKPAIETTFNTNLFTGRDIVPFYMKNKPTDEQVFEGTSGTARGIGSAVGTSPLNIEHLIKGYGGEVGLQGLNLVDNTLNKVGVIPEEQIGGRSIPYGFSRRFTEGYADFESTIPKGTSLKDTKESVGSLKTKGDFISISNKSEKDKSGDYVSRDKYDAIINAYTKSDGELNNIQKYDNKELQSAIRDTAKEAVNALKEFGLDGVKADSRTAQEWARFVKNSEGKDELSVEKTLKTTLKNVYKNQFDARTDSFYSLSDNDMRTAIQNGQITKEQLDKAIQVDNELTAAGLQSYLQIGKTLRAELGYGVPTSKKTASKSGGSRKSGSKSKSSKFGNYSIAGFSGGVNATSLNKSLRALLEKTS